MVRSKPFRNSRGDLLDRRYVLFSDCPAGVALNSEIDGVDLNGVGQVVGEVDHHAKTDEKQKDRNADGKPRIYLGSSACFQADGKQASGTVDEGGQKPAENHLCWPIAKEVAQQPR
jgi:hypothetical protein